MRALVVGSAIAALAFGAAFVPACTLTSDLGGLSGGVAGDGGALRAEDAPAGEAGPVPEASTDGAALDADVSATYAAEVLADGPVAYYRFEDPAVAASAKDEIGNHTATVVTQSSKGVIFGAPGVRGTGVILDGTSLFDIGDLFDFAGKVPFALELWVKPSAPNANGGLLGKFASSGPDGYDFSLSSGTPAFVVFKSGPSTPAVQLGASSDVSLPVAFTHLVVSIAYKLGKGNATLYVNGAPSGTGGYDSQGDLPDTAAHLQMGTYFGGTLDEVAIYDKALSPERILAHYNAGKP
jgi:hypothetical protein